MQTEILPYPNSFSKSQKSDVHPSRCRRCVRRGSGGRRKRSESTRTQAWAQTGALWRDTDTRWPQEVGAGESRCSCGNTVISWSRRCPMPPCFSGIRGSGRTSAGRRWRPVPDVDDRSCPERLGNSALPGNRGPKTGLCRRLNGSALRAGTRNRYRPLATGSVHGDPRAASSGCRPPAPSARATAALFVCAYPPSRLHRCASVRQDAP